MPDAKDNAKLSGDVHPPEVEDAVRSPSGRPLAQGGEDGAAAGSSPRDLENEARPGKGVNQAGYLKDKDKDAPGTGGEG